ncbi:MAG: hypothetical protein A2992_00500 [Elusimicrobia bacterium RIFCSPLOWO2_01_FULL_59_12]|nr:MAG: hypothetical protein A2992_00500 [Elusimicrobia bacterium RIFCSPLOWO2_01_FULL_59_12]
MLALVAVLVSETYVSAYLDAGTGSMIIQLLLGGAAGLAVLLRMGWRRLRDRFRPGRKDEPTQVDE